MTAGCFAITEVWLSDGWNDRGTLVVGDGGLGGGGTGTSRRPTYRVC